MVTDAGQNKTDTPFVNNNEVKGDWLLIPGVSAGQTQVGENAERVFKAFGKPDAGDAAMQKAMAVWYRNHHVNSYSTAIYTVRDTGDRPMARIQQIRITSPAFKTKEGIGTTSSLADIEARFVLQKKDTYQDAGRSYTIYNSEEGIAFEVGPDKKCVAIIIHQAGNLKATYLELRTTNKYIDPAVKKN